MIIKYDFPCGPANEDRKLHIYLPNDYYETEERYPVVYMFDGHNLFFNEDASFGTCQGIKEFMDGWKKKLIIVGMECSHSDRISEYCPYNIYMHHFGNVKGYGNKIMEWVIGDLKNHIDTTYRTLPFRECTAISGSSMGGMMALYAILHHNDYFSKAAVISPAIFTSQSKFKKELRDKAINPDTRVYFSWGTEEWGGWDCAGAKKVYELEEMIQNQGGRTYLNCQQGGYHCEASWSQQTDTWMEFLWF